MKEPFTLFDFLNRAKLPPRDRFVLYLLGMIVLIINSLTGLVLVKELPSLLEWVLTEIFKLL